MGAHSNLMKPKGDSFRDAYRKTFPNQRKFGKHIYEAFKRASSCLAIAPTQSGKTGSMIALATEFLKHNHYTPQNVFIFTPHSSCEWVTQTQQRFPAFFKNQIFHRNQIEDLISRISRAPTHTLLIIDECHIAAKIGQSLHLLYSKLRLFDLQYLAQHHIKLAHFTATPCGLDIDFKRFWGDHGHICSMDVPDSYLSYDHLLSQNRLLHARDLCGYQKETKTIHNQVYKNIQEIAPFLDTAPRYHIIRTPPGHLHHIVIQNFKQVFPHATLISEPEFNDDINALLNILPTRHTFIFIKDKLRCAKTIAHQHIGVLYERFVQKPLQHVVLQSLAGRLTGYHLNQQAVVFTHTQHHNRRIPNHFWHRSFY